MPGSKVTVVVKNTDGNIVETMTTVVTRGDGRWTAKLKNPVKKDFTVEAYQEYNEKDKFYNEAEYGGKTSDNSSPSTVQPAISDDYYGKLSMPDFEMWVEDMFVVNSDEKAEIEAEFRNHNKDVKGKGNKTFEKDVDKVEYSHNNKSINVTFSDGSKITIDASNIKFHQITEPSRKAEVETIYAVDNVIKGKISGEGPFDKIKINLILKVGDDEPGFCDEKKCTLTKNSTDPVELQVNPDGTFSYTLPGNDTISLGQKIGISVKEYRKFPSCLTTQAVLKKPEKVGVRDPKKLTDEDKKAIDTAIRKANTTEKGVSKMPDGTGDGDGQPAFIEFDNDGNVRIISPNDVETDWDENYKPIYGKNEDGTYKLNSGAEVIVFKAKDLVKNLKPNSPMIKVDTDNGKVIITPPAYTEPGEDTDLASYEITYKDASDTDKTIKLTRKVSDDGNTTWESDVAEVNEATGAVILQIKDIAVGGTVEAIAKDKGGLEGDITVLESDPARETLPIVQVSYDPSGGTGNMAVDKLNKGVNYNLLPNGFVAPKNKEFKCWKIGDEEYEANKEIKVDDNTTVEAVWKDIIVEVSFDANGHGIAPEKQTMKKGENATKPSDLVEDGYIFGGWYMEPSCETYYDFSTPVNKNITLYAKWEKKSELKPGNNSKKPSSKPGKNKKGDKISGAKKAPETGDNNIIYVYTYILILSLGGIFILNRKRREN